MFVGCPLDANTLVFIQITGGAIACDYTIAVPANFTTKLNYLNVTAELASGTALQPKRCFSKALAATGEAAGFVRPTIQPSGTTQIIQIFDDVPVKPVSAPAITVYSKTTVVGDVIIYDNYEVNIG
jgi:hypothetical protein